MQALAAMVDPSNFAVFRHPGTVPYGFVSHLTKSSGSSGSGSSLGSSSNSSSSNFLCPPSDYPDSKSVSPNDIHDPISLHSSCSNYACSNVNAKIVKFRGHNVAAFDMDGKEMICLPQVYELFLKHLVGGLHTVYTKLKRLDINPTVCNVDQPGVNRCKLLETADFEKLYDDCANTSTRPGRPSKRGFEDWTGISTLLKREKPKDLESSSNDVVFNRQLPQIPQLTPQQLLMQQFLALSQKTNGNNFDGGEGEDEDQTQRANDDGTPLNLSKSGGTSENDADSLESMRKEDSSPNNSVSDRGGSNSNSLSVSLEGGSSSGKNDESSLMNKVMSLIEIASQQFRHEREELWRERNEIQVLRESFHKIVQEERNLRKKLESETRKCAAYEKRYKFVNRQLLLVKAELRRCRERNGTGGSSSSGSNGSG